jgi:hypothetical protein
MLNTKSWSHLISANHKAACRKVAEIIPQQFFPQNPRVVHQEYSVLKEPINHPYETLVA